MSSLNSRELSGARAREAGKGRTFGDQPAWWAGFEKQYREREKLKAAEADETPDRSDRS